MKLITVGCEDYLLSLTNPLSFRAKRHQIKPLSSSRFESTTSLVSVFIEVTNPASFLLLQPWTFL